MKMMTRHAQGAWLGGQTFRDLWNFSSSYCSWPFTECTANCISEPYLAAL